MNPTLIKNYKAGGAIAAARIVKFGANDLEVVQGAAAADKLIGALHQPGGVAQGDPADVVLAGIAEVEAGGAIARGDLLTADADGKAVVAAAGNRIIGFALVSAAAGDLFNAHISQGVA